jgi:hypothetical protein
MAWWKKIPCLSTEAIFTNSSRNVHKCTVPYRVRLSKGGGGGEVGIPHDAPTPLACLKRYCTSVLYSSQLCGTLTIAPPPSWTLWHSTRTIRHCNDSPHKRFHIETIRPLWGRTVRPHPNRSIRPLRSRSKRWLWQSDPFSASPGGLGDSSGDDTQMALLKNGAAPPERTSPTHGSAGRKLDLT